jgi:flagellar biogenesis protein FliO
VTASGGWWLGTTGIVLALALCGAVSLAARRGWRWPQPQGGSVLRVIGRTRISPRHTVHLLAVGDRVLIVGTGAQGAPALLGELTDPDELQRLMPAPDAQARPRSVVVDWRRQTGDDR